MLRIKLVWVYLKDWCNRFFATHRMVRNNVKEVDLFALSSNSLLIQCLVLWKKNNNNNRKSEEPWLAHGGLQAFCSLLSIYHPCQLLQWWPWWWNAVGSGWVFFCYSFLEEREGVIEKRQLSI